MIALILFLLSAPVMAQCTLADAVSAARPGAVWVLRGDDYDGLEWQDSSKKRPSKTEVGAALAACEDADTLRFAQKRAARFTVKLSTATPTQKVNALILLMDLDK